MYALLMPSVRGIIFQDFEKIEKFGIHRMGNYFLVKRKNASISWQRFILQNVVLSLYSIDAYYKYTNRRHCILLYSTLFYSILMCSLYFTVFYYILMHFTLFTNRAIRRTICIWVPLRGCWLQPGKNCNKTYKALCALQVN